jgi:hypothetical protein
LTIIITCHITTIKAYSERVDSFLSEYAFIFVIWEVVQKLCNLKKWIPPGLSIEILRFMWSSLVPGYLQPSDTPMPIAVTPHSEVQNK